MKIVTMIARYLLGLMFLVFGSNMFLQFIPMGQLPPCLPLTIFTWWAQSWSSPGCCCL